MKRIIILAVVLFAAVTFNAEAKRHYYGVGGYFYTELAPYGSWIEVDYGVIVWRPTIIRVDWMPYQTGRWVWTYDGWYWDSYEPFGFITYHYGRWYYDDYYGWLWYPDYEWAPAWVEWRYDNNYIGWAPLHPYAVFSISVGIYFSNTYYTPYSHWHFVTYNNFCDPYVYNYYVGPSYKYRIYSGTKYRNKYTYRNGRVQNRGIDVEYVKVRSGREIVQRDLTRVRDSQEFKRDGFVNRDEIRTLDLKKDELVRNDLGRMEIKRDNRKTSLEVDKLQIGKRENISNGTRNDKSKDRSLDIRKNDRTRNKVNETVDKVFDKNRTETIRDTDINKNRKIENIELQKRETGKISDQNENVRIMNDPSTKDGKQVKISDRVKTNGTVTQNIKKLDQKKEVKQVNTRVTNSDQVKKYETKEQSRNTDKPNIKVETKVKTDRSTEKDTSKERNRR
jgi:hypothetical protein